MNDIEKNFMSRNIFTKLVEDAVIKKRLSYMDAIIHICEEENIDPEDTKKYLSPSIKSKLEAEAIELNLLPSQNTLIFE